MRHHLHDALHPRPRFVPGGVDGMVGDLGQDGGASPRRIGGQSPIDVRDQLPRSAVAIQSRGTTVGVAAPGSPRHLRWLAMTVIGFVTAQENPIG